MRIIKITESDLTNIVKRVIESKRNFDDPLFRLFVPEEMNDLIIQIGPHPTIQRVIDSYNDIMGDKSSPLVDFNEDLFLFYNEEGEKFTPDEVFSELNNEVNDYDDFWDYQNLQESNIPKHIQRRYSDIKDAVNDYLLFFNMNQLVGNFDDFRSELAWDVANEVLTKSKNDGDLTTSRNQMIQFIKNHFYEELKDYYDRNNYWSRNK